jgi:hypothetical protein
MRIGPLASAHAWEFAVCTSHPARRPGDAATACRARHRPIRAGPKSEAPAVLDNRNVGSTVVTGACVLTCSTKL